MKYDNTRELIEGWQVNSQSPIDDRLIFADLADLQDLGTSDVNAYRYFEGMVVHILSTQKSYMWSEASSGALTTGFTYPANVTSKGVNYGGRTFNFVELSSTIALGTTVLFVSDQGDDSTAVKGDASKPWLTLLAAKDAASSGDTIIVYPGTYPMIEQEFLDRSSDKREASLWKDGIKWFFMAGAIVDYQVPRSYSGYVFYNDLNNENCYVYGYADFEINNGAWNGNGGHNSGLLLQTGQNCNLVLECNNVVGNDNELMINMLAAKADITIREELSCNRGKATYFTGGSTFGSDVYNIFINKVYMYNPISGWTILPTFGVGGSEYKLNIEFNEIETPRQSFDTSEASVLNCTADDIHLTMKGKYVYDSRGDSTSNFLFFIRNTHNSKIDIHIDNCESLFINSDYGMIMVENEDTEAATEPNHIRFTGRYEAMSGKVISTGPADATYGNDTYILDGTFISHDAEVANFKDANVNIEISGELRCNWNDAAGHGIKLEDANTNIKLKNLEIVCVNASANSVHSTVVTTIEAFNYHSTNLKNSNVTFTKPLEVVPSNGNFATDSLTFSVDRTHNLNGNTVALENGSITASGSTLTLGAASPTASSILDIQSTTAGFLAPRMTTAQKNAIATPATSLLVFDTDNNQYEYYDGAAWSSFGGGTDTNFATDDLTVTANRTHDMAGNDMKFDLFDSTGQFILSSGQSGYGNFSFTPNSTSSGGFASIDNGVGSINFDASRKIVLTSTTNTARVSINNTTIASGNAFKVTGHGSTSSTTTTLFENSSGTDLFKIDDDGGFGLGIRATYNDVNSVSIGADANATGNEAIAIGRVSNASSNQSIAIGTSADASSGIYNTVVGRSASTSSTYGTVMGYNAGAGASASAFGTSVSATGTRSVALGEGSTSSGTNSVAIKGTASNTYAVAIGRNSEATATSSYMLYGGATTRTNSVADSFAVNFDEVDHALFIGQTADSYFNGSGSFGFGTTTPNASAALDIESTTAGLLVPRMTTVQKNAITTPATSLLVFDTDNSQYEYYNGTSWTSFGGGGGNTIYTADDTLTGNRIVDLSGNTLTFKGTYTSNYGLLAVESTDQLLSGVAYRDTTNGFYGFTGYRNTSDYITIGCETGVTGVAIEPAPNTQSYKFTTTGFTSEEDVTINGNTGVNANWSANFGTLNLKSSNQSFVGLGLSDTVNGYYGGSFYRPTTQYLTLGGASAVNGVAIETNGNNQRLIVDNSGNVTIGNSSASARLHVKGSGATSSTSSLLVEDSAGTDLLELKDDGQEIRNASAQLITQFNSSATHPYVEINSGTGSHSSIIFSQASSQKYLFGFDNATSGFRVRDISAGANRIVVTSGGQVNLFDPTVTTADFNVKGSGLFTEAGNNPLTVSSSSNTNMFLAVNSNSSVYNSQIQFQQGGAANWNIGSLGNTQSFWFYNHSSNNTVIELDTSDNIIMANLPTSSAGLPTGALWNNSGVINIV